MLSSKMRKYWAKVEIMVLAYNLETFLTTDLELVAESPEAAQAKLQNMIVAMFNCEVLEIHGHMNNTSRDYSVEWKNE